MTTIFVDPIDCRDDGDDGCYVCGGSGWELVCIDDICHGIGYCMHGDGEIPCRGCVGKPRAAPTEAVAEEK